MVTFSPWKNDSIVNCIIQQKNTRTGFVNMSGNINSVMKQLKTIYRDHTNILGSRLKMQIYFFIFHCLLPSRRWSCKYVILGLTIHQIFCMIGLNTLHDYSPANTGSPIFKTTLVLLQKNIWRIINTTASIWHEHMLPYLSLDIVCSSKLTVFQEENHSLLRTDNVRRQIANDIFPPSGDIPHKWIVLSTPADWVAQRWLAKYYSPPKNKMAFVGILSQM